MKTSAPAHSPRAKLPSPRSLRSLRLIGRAEVNRRARKEPKASKPLFRDAWSYVSRLCGSARSPRTVPPRSSSLRSELFQFKFHLTIIAPPRPADVPRLAAPRQPGGVPPSDWTEPGRSSANLQLSRPPPATNRAAFPRVCTANREEMSSSPLFSRLISIDLYQPALDPARSPARSSGEFASPGWHAGGSSASSKWSRP